MKLIEHLEHVITLIDNRKPLAEIKSAVLAMHEEVSGYEQAHPKYPNRDANPAPDKIAIAEPETGEQCPFCKRMTLQLIEIKKHSNLTFAQVGFKQHYYKCLNPSCSKSYDKQVAP